MLTDTAPGWTHEAFNFTLRAVAWSLGLFGFLRWGWVETHGLLPLTQLQGWLAVRLYGTPAFPIQVTLACSGADALALCLAAILAYPTNWRMRLAGVGGGLGLILGLNTLRIGALGRAAASPAWFEALHVYVWPAVLALAIAGYVFAWMRFTDRRRTVGVAPALLERLTRRFVLLTVAFLFLFTAASPLYLESPGVLTVAAFIARAAAAALHLLGVEASAAANVLQTPRGGFMVTQECISTPLIPIYLAAVLAYSSTWLRGALGLLATAPLFVGLGVVRLLVVALPATLVASPVFLAHAFYQLLLAAVVVFLVAFWRHGADGTALRRALLGVVLGLACAYLLGAPYTRLVAQAAETWGVSALSGFAADTPLDDPQGAIAILPTFQVGFYVALWMAAFVAFGWRRFLVGLALLAVTQVAAFAALHFLANYSGITPHMRDVRAWAVVGPLFVITVLYRLFREPARRWWETSPVVEDSEPADAAPRGSAYRRFWVEVGDHFPDIGGAVSTRYYLDNERRLFTEHFPPLEGLRVFKTDLWDEAKNTRILAWASQQGARAYGADISEPTVIQARAAFDRAPFHGAVADIRELPFRTASFDAIYSMGTIEHFRDPERALEEMIRVLRPGGRAIVGVPNRHDPFLRPLLAAALQALGLYAYGYEKSFSRRALREMLERAGFEIVTETAILFIPGWLRMLDLACYSWCRPLTAVTAALVWPFVFLDRRLPAVRRHGYLLATVATKPESKG